MPKISIVLLISAFLNGCASLNPIYHLEKNVMFHPSKEVRLNPKDAGLDYENIYFKTIDGVTLNAWLIKYSESAPTLLFFHGNAGNNSHRLEKIVNFYQLGLNVFIVDYRGYGKSKGTPCESGAYFDAEASYDYLAGRKDIDMNKIVVYGESIGGAFAIDLATKRKIAALIVDSTFTSAKEMAKGLAPIVPSFLLCSRMDSISKIKSIAIPKLLIHSQDDEIIPYCMGQKLFSVAPNPKEFLTTTGGHNDCYYRSKDKVNNGIRDFLKENNLF